MLSWERNIQHGRSIESEPSHPAVSDPRMVPAAILAVVLLVTVAAFQAAPGSRSPRCTEGQPQQNPGMLPQPLRIASGVAAVVVYPLIIALVLASAGLIEDGWLPVDGSLIMWGSPACWG